MIARLRHVGVECWALRDTRDALLVLGNIERGDGLLFEVNSADKNVVEPLNHLDTIDKSAKYLLRRRGRTYVALLPDIVCPTFSLVRRHADFRRIRAAMRDGTGRTWANLRSPFRASATAVLISRIWVS